MAALGYRTISIQGVENAVRLEAKAGGSGIKPGHLLAMSSGDVIVHATADGVSNRLVAVEDWTAEHATDNIIDIAYTSGDTVFYVQGNAGAVLYMWLANSQNAVEGVSQLYSNGDGTLKVVAPGATLLEGALVGYPDESLNNTSGAAARLKVRIA